MIGANRGAWLEARKVDFHRRSVAHFRIDFDVAGRLLDETIDHRKAEAGAGFRALGGEEGLEDLFNVFRRNAAARIGDGDFDIIADG